MRPRFNCKSRLLSLLLQGWTSEGERSDTGNQRPGAEFWRHSSAGNTRAAVGDRRRTAAPCS